MRILTLGLFFLMVTQLPACKFMKGALGKKTPAEPPGKSIRYLCDTKLQGGSAYNTKEIYFTWLENTQNSSQETVTVLVSNADFQNSKSSIILIIDRERKVIDQIRNAQGKPIQFDLSERFISEDEALSQAHIRIGNLLLDAAPRAFTQEDSTGNGFVHINFESQQYAFAPQDVLPQVNGYGPIPKKVLKNNRPVCAFDRYLN